MITRTPLLTLLLLAACGGRESPDDAATLPPFEDLALDEYTLAVLPDLSAFGELVDLGLEPVVMVNLLRYRDQAVGEGFEGLTGEEAYGQYISAIGDIQNEIGSRLIVSGEVDAQVVGTSDPVFHSVGVLEYVDVEAFMGYSMSIPPEAEAARIAGLEGQWLIASTTVAEDGSALGDDCGNEEWSAKDAATATGLSTAQVERLLQGPADEAVVVVELLRSSGEDTSLESWLDAMKTVQEDLGARQLWQGALVLQLLGTASPGFEVVLATEYPSRHCYLTALADDRVTELAQARVDGTEAHWIYAAAPNDFAF